MNFQPFQHFVFEMYQHLHPVLLKKMAEFMADNFFSADPGKRPKIIVVHYRHGNGETTDFVETTSTGEKRLGRRADFSTQKVIAWLQNSVKILAAKHGIAEGQYKVLLETDSSKVQDMWRETDSSVIVFDEENKRAREGKGFVVIGVGPSFSPSATNQERIERCYDESINTMMNLMMMGLGDLLVTSKHSGFNWPARVMMSIRNKPYCMSSRSKQGERGMGFRCFVNGTDPTDIELPPLLAKVSCAESGLGQGKCERF
jgi:hypothetical protein